MDSVILGTTAVLAVGLGSYFAARDISNISSSVLSSSRVKSYPFMAGISLLSINLMFTYLDPYYVNLGFTFYFGLAGTNSIWFLLRAFFGKKSRKLFTYPHSKSILFEFVIPSEPVDFLLSDLPLYIIGVVINVIYFTTKNNLANNIIAFSVAFYGVLSIRVEKFTSAAPLLWSLLIYDVFFVYQTDVMTSVAQKLEGPVKLVINLHGHGNSVLGLGDLVLPGIFISTCSRFDHFIKKVTGRRSPYWFIAMVFYATAMGVTDYVCYKTRRGQPALLFITPLVTIPILFTALVRREYRAFCSYSG
ncbi:Clan AD, family A22, presenilin-like aspartic peptidase [Trichomonas vaginalis G3]|uniref:Clan AD, family A22, presenilin-like aspartic peptidase n=1 Tax=Trichomonas vaginalis (strain ATCC PRA-98 / G3) TaxID=412133 RepID=A2E3W6_TRIV3|nr:aspartic endopeptidase activity, intramembrane cleaving [Trichomonas vaginalis G3]EAY12621.1 Clan AD, family A22, presenilin-like aspartic peptidase [Trichomonas vaginalis G3]KAI5546982.1 aspartic endopeptidase activity, intramembrane cleaving [Trichomonas vaginalis G3]|eukprot:XP_001324844.1 Clan AD, family A22, presenilin-like aspartic peptidase [Trichomonas vaginalis G3]